MLTDLFLRRYNNPDGKRKIFWDTGGLGIRIGKRKKTWVFRYSHNGKRVLLTLGTYPAMTLLEARAEAAKTALDVQKGINPVAQLREAKKRRISAPTVAEVVDEFFEVELKEKKSAVETLRLLQKDVVSAWGDIKIADIKKGILLFCSTIFKKGPQWSETGCMVL